MVRRNNLSKTEVLRRESVRTRYKPTVSANRQRRMEGGWTRGGRREEMFRPNNLSPAITEQSCLVWTSEEETSLAVWSRDCRADGLSHFCWGQFGRRRLQNLFSCLQLCFCSAVRPHDAQTSAKMKTTCAKTLWINSALNLARKLRVLDCRLPLRQTFEKVSEKDPQ